MIFASPPILGTPTPSTNGQIMGLWSPPLLEMQYIHVAIKYLTKLMKERIESYGTFFFN